MSDELPVRIKLDNEVLGALFRRVIHDPDRHGAEDPYVWLDGRLLWFDGSIDVTDVERAAILRAKPEESL